MKRQRESEIIQLLGCICTSTCGSIIIIIIIIIISSSSSSSGPGESPSFDTKQKLNPKVKRKAESHTGPRPLIYSKCAPSLTINEQRALHPGCQTSCSFLVLSVPGTRSENRNAEKSCQPNSKAEKVWQVLLIRRKVLQYCDRMRPR